MHVKKNLLFLLTEYLKEKLQDLSLRFLFLLSAWQTQKKENTQNYKKSQ
jgi:hypothetical protein